MYQNLTKWFAVVLIIFCSQLEMLNAQMYWNNACSFEGTNSSYISRGNSSSLNITGSFTLEAWVNPVNSTVPSPQILLQKREGSANNGYSLILLNGKPAVRTNNSSKLVSTYVLPNNVWTHVSGSYDAGTNTFSFSINGMYDTSAVVAGAAPIGATDSLYIGKGLNSAFEGQMDEIRIWNRALLTDQKYQFRRTSLGTNSGQYYGLVLSLTFQDNEGSGDTFSMVDWSGSGNNCIAHGVSQADLSSRPLETINTNESLEMDGLNDYVSGPDLTILSPQNVFTIETWISPRSHEPNCIIIHKGTPDGATTNYSLRLNNQFLQVIVNDLVVLNSNDAIPLNRWSHVAFVYDGNSFQNFLYVNGKVSDFSANAGINVTNGSDSIYLGGAPSMSCFDGFIDEFRMKHVAKSEEEINRFMFTSIDEANDLPGSELVFNFDGYLVSNLGSVNRMYFRNHSALSHAATETGKPVAPLIRKDDASFQEGFFIKTSGKRIPGSGATGIIQDTIDIFLNESISDINLFVAINQGSENSLDLSLIAPNGQSVFLYNNNILNSNMENLITIFDDESDSSIVNNRYVSFSPSVKPFTDMNSTFAGVNTSGKWRLVIEDSSPGDTGRLYGWGIQFNNSTSKDDLLSVKCLIQGFYDSGTNLTIADTMKLVLRDIVSPYQIIDSSKGILESNGTVTAKFNNAQPGSFYHVQLNHRNSIETWTSIPFAFNPLTSQGFYDLSKSLITAYGSNMVLIDITPVKFAIYGGDVNQDDVIDATDAGMVDNAALNFLSGYVSTDVTGDNLVDASDAAIVDNNAYNFVTAVIP